MVWGKELYFGLDRFLFAQGFCYWRETSIDNSYNDMRVIIQDASWERHTNDMCMYANTFEIIKYTPF